MLKKNLQLSDCLVFKSWPFALVMIQTIRPQLTTPTTTAYSHLKSQWGISKSELDYNFQVIHIIQQSSLLIDLILALHVNPPSLLQYVKGTPGKSSILKSSPNCYPFNIQNSRQYMRICFQTKG